MRQLCFVRHTTNAILKVRTYTDRSQVQVCVCACLTKECLTLSELHAKSCASLVLVSKKKTEGFDSTYQHKCVFRSCLLDRQYKGMVRKNSMVSGTLVRKKNGYPGQLCLPVCVLLLRRCCDHGSYLFSFSTCNVTHCVPLHCC